MRRGEVNLPPAEVEVAREALAVRAERAGAAVDGTVEARAGVALVLGGRGAAAPVDSAASVKGGLSVRPVGVQAEAAAVAVVHNHGRGISGRRAGALRDEAVCRRRRRPGVVHEPVQSVRVAEVGPPMESHERQKVAAAT